jgi:hypothetical protein
MKPSDLFKDIFTLAVRLVGLLFLALAFRDVPAILNLVTLAGYTKEDLLGAILPVVFDLAVAWWLLGSKFLIRRAYPERRNPLNYSPSPAESPAAATPSPTAPATPDANTAEKKLAALLKKT